MASKTEGFGLPLIEAKWNGIPVLASDIPVFREVGKDYPVYFPLNRPTDLKRVIEEFEKKPRRPEGGKGAPWLTWDEATRILIENVMELYAKESRQRPVEGVLKREPCRDER
jgi:alpha-1,2-rhamnosyltransferase